MHHSLIKKIVLLSLSGFFFAIVAIAFHDKDDTFLLRSRSICQTRAVISGTMSRYQVDSAPVATVVYVGLAASFLLSVPFVYQNATIFIPSQVAYIYPNKAPPVRS